MEAEPGRFLSRRPTPAGATVDLAAWLDDFARQPEHRGALVHRATLPARAARYGALSVPRRTLRTDANVILSNPDMLHPGILPSHPKWARFLSRLRFVVVDEMHAYRGIFGSHVANVLRRLDRLVAHYQGRCRFVLCSATIRNPAELARGLIGRPVTVIDDDGAPRGERQFVFWNPPR